MTAQQLASEMEGSSSRKTVERLKSPVEKETQRVDRCREHLFISIQIAGVSDARHSPHFGESLFLFMSCNGAFTQDIGNRAQVETEQAFPVSAIRAKGVPDGAEVQSPVALRGTCLVMR